MGILEEPSNILSEVIESRFTWETNGRQLTIGS